MKPCIKCGEHKAHDEFRVKVNGTGLRSEGNICRPCESQDSMERTRYKREVLKRHKKIKGCAICGYREHAVALDYDHRDPAKKSFTIGQSASNKGLRTLAKEIAKCDVLCSNCHRVKTHREGDTGHGGGGRPKGPQMKAERLAERKQ